MAVTVAEQTHPVQLQPYLDLLGLPHAHGQDDPPICLPS